MSTVERIEQDLREALTEPVYMAVGEASACWGDLSGAGVFDDVQAAKVASELLDRIVSVAMQAVA